MYGGKNPPSRFGSPLLAPVQFSRVRLSKSWQQTPPRRFDRPSGNEDELFQGIDVPLLYPVVALLCSKGSNYCLRGFSQFYFIG